MFLQVEEREPKMMDSYNRWGVETVAGDIKEAICRVSDSAFNPAENANIPTVTYEVALGRARFGPRSALPCLHRFDAPFCG